MRFDGPFVLLEDARPAGGARIFQNPLATIVAHDRAAAPSALEQVRLALRQGRYVAGWIGYEAGHGLEEKLLALPAKPMSGPVLWFGVFEQVVQLSKGDLEGLLPDAEGAWISAPRPRLSRAQYQQAFTRAQRYILAGDIYQINLSYRADVTLLGDPLAAYARLRETGRGGWSGVICTGADWIVSTSPELFFRIGDRVIEARPMKGTAKRSTNPEEDRRIAERLQADQKERAENVMIVDLMRNDISRIAEIGSVHVPELFNVETYPTLHTLTSTVRARVGAGRDAVDAMGALFPCGSVTGAPKIRAMEIIDELEQNSRGVYTGSMGWFAPDGAAEFNVAIRTLSISGGRAELGLGSAIVADSDADREWRECQTKGAFISAQAQRFDLIETMRFEPDLGLLRFDLHMRRLGISAGVFGFMFDEASVRASLADAVAHLSGPSVVRLTLSAAGLVSLSFRATPAASHMRVALAPLPVSSSDFRLRHKTTLRDFYDDARIASGADEVVFVDDDGFITEGSIGNVFVEQDGALITPPESRGLLPGVLRAELIGQGKAREGDLRPEHLIDGFLIGNSVRGLLRARLNV